MASGLVHSTPDRAVWIRVLAVDIVFCSWPRHFPLTVCFSTRVYQSVPPNLIGSLSKSLRLVLLRLLCLRRSGESTSPRSAKF